MDRGIEVIDADGAMNAEQVSDVCYRILGRSFAIRTTSRGFAEALERSLGMLEITPEPGLPTYRLVEKAGSDDVDVLLDEATLVRDTPPAIAYEYIVWHIVREAVESASDRLLIHAGVVEADGRAILFPAGSGSGKSTLVTGLVHAGFGFLSDEIAAIDLDDCFVHPVQRSMVLKEGSRAVLAHLLPEIPAAARAYLDNVIPIRPRDFGASEERDPAPVGFVIAPRFEAGAETRLEPISRAAALTELAANAFNLEKFGARAIHALAGVVRNASCFRLVTGALDPAVEAVRSTTKRAGS